MIHIKSRSFTLLEIIVAMLIMGVVLVGTVGSFISCHKFTIQAGRRLSAINLTRRIAETLKVYVSADPNTPAGAGIALAPGLNKPYTDAGVTTPLPEYVQQCTYTVTDLAGGLKEVTITATITEP